MEDELYLTDLIDAGTLQTIQDAFCRLTGIAAGVCDANGVAVTKDSISSDFCMNYTKKSPEGRKRCELCDKQGGEMALKAGRSIAYRCHTGLVDFAAPILADGRLVGSIVGGQVCVDEIDEEKIRKIAVEIGVDPEEYVAAIKKNPRVKEEDVTRAAEFVYTISNILSDMAVGHYQSLQASRDIERAASMKSDFLANMSHEIRTPMNAVIGMAEMALREELPPIARDYINQIKSSGKALLAIINDILDFSKIESGKMDITVAEYEPMSVVNDVANIVMTRIGDKDVELILDVAPDIPNKLLGDCNRIKQIIVNLANNAVKFTKHGQVTLRVAFEKINKDKIDLQLSVKDTGIGIKKEDMNKLFQSFQQVDSKRNRNIEGTGLGLAISKRLVTLMGGEIGVESEYGKGSRFFFHIPQTIFEEKPSVKIKEQDLILCFGLIQNRFLNRQLKNDVTRLGGVYDEIKNIVELEEKLTNESVYLFVEHAMFSEQVEDFICRSPQITAVLMIDYRNTVDTRIANLIIVKKPLYVLNLAAIFNHEDLHLLHNSAAYEDFEFTAPEANVLIVDDNAINLTVAEGLLKPLDMKIDTALSGKEAVQKISVKKYDIVLMDHMMPELDGVETTHIIRRFHEEYNDVPIIALTANAVEGARDMFLKEGMNDFIAKPIEMRNIVTKLRQWLPEEKIQRVYQMQMEKEEEEVVIDIPGLDTANAMRLLGTEKLFWAVLKDYYRVIRKKAKLIKELETEEDWAAYTIEVHALKSASKQIGATELSEKAANMERAGNARDKELIHKHTDDMLDQYLHYADILEPYCAEEQMDDNEKQDLTSEVLLDQFSQMRDAMEELDMDRMDKVVKAMTGYRYSEEGQKFFERLQNAVSDVDVDVCEEIMQAWENAL